MCVRVSGRRNESRAAVVVDSQEGLLSGGGTASVDGHLEIAVGSVLEADRHGQPGCELAMDLALRGAGADRAPGDEVSHVLRADGLQEFGGRGQTQCGDLLQESAGCAQARGDVVAAVQMGGIVDEALPANSGARLFEVGPHDDQQVFFVLLGLADQPAGVFETSLGIVDGARANDHQKAIVHAVHDGADLVAATVDDGSRAAVERQLGDEVLRGGEAARIGQPADWR